MKKYDYICTTNGALCAFISRLEKGIMLEIIEFFAF